MKKLISSGFYGSDHKKKFEDCENLSEKSQMLEEKHDLDQIDLYQHFYSQRYKYKPNDINKLNAQAQKKTFYNTLNTSDNITSRNESKIIDLSSRIRNHSPLLNDNNAAQNFYNDKMENDFIFNLNQKITLTNEIDLNKSDVLKRIDKDESLLKEVELSIENLNTSDLIQFKKGNKENYQKKNNDVFYKNFYENNKNLVYSSNKKFYNVNGSNIIKSENALQKIEDISCSIGSKSKINHVDDDKIGVMMNYFNSKKSLENEEMNKNQDDLNKDKYFTFGIRSKQNFFKENVEENLINLKNKNEYNKKEEFSYDKKFEELKTNHLLKNKITKDVESELVKNNTMNFFYPSDRTMNNIKKIKTEEKKIENQNYEVENIFPFNEFFSPKNQSKEEIHKRNINLLEKNPMRNNNKITQNNMQNKSLLKKNNFECEDHHKLKEKNKPLKKRPFLTNTQDYFSFVETEKKNKEKCDLIKDQIENKEYLNKKLFIEKMEEFNIPESNQLFFETNTNDYNSYQSNKKIEVKKLSENNKKNYQMKKKILKFEVKKINKSSENHEEISPRSEITLNQNLFPKDNKQMLNNINYDLLKNKNLPEHRIKEIKKNEENEHLNINTGGNLLRLSGNSINTNILKTNNISLEFPGFLSNNKNDQIIYESSFINNPLQKNNDVYLNIKEKVQFYNNHWRNFNTSNSTNQINNNFIAENTEEKFSQENEQNEIEYQINNIKKTEIEYQDNLIYECEDNKINPNYENKININNNENLEKNTFNIKLNQDEKFPKPNKIMKNGIIKYQFDPIFNNNIRNIKVNRVGKLKDYDNIQKNLVETETNKEFHTLGHRYTKSNHTYSNPFELLNTPNNTNIESPIKNRFGQEKEHLAFSSINSEKLVNEESLLNNINKIKAEKHKMNIIIKNLKDELRIKNNDIYNFKKILVEKNILNEKNKAYIIKQEEKLKNFADIVDRQNNHMSVTSKEFYKSNNSERLSSKKYSSLNKIKHNKSYANSANFPTKPSSNIEHSKTAKNRNCSKYLSLGSRQLMQIMQNIKY